VTTAAIIADPWFYAVAVPAVLLMGLSKSGFGGAALLNRPDVKAPVEDDQRRTEG